MKSLHTKTDEDAEIEVYLNLIVVAEYKKKKVRFWSTAATVSWKYITMKELKEMLAEEGIEFFHISENKIACKPHVIGWDDDDGLIYNPLFYHLLPEKLKEPFKYHSFQKSYRKEFRKMKRQADAKRKPAAEATVKSNENINTTSGINSMAAGKKKIVSSIKKKTSTAQKKAYREGK